jgi:HlyD family secretion protein
VPISAVVVKSDTSAVSDVKVLEPSDDKIKRLKAKRSVFWKWEVKLKYALSRPEFKMIRILKWRVVKKRWRSDYGPYTTVSKELNSNDMVYIKSENEKKKASSFILE